MSETKPRPIMAEKFLMALVESGAIGVMKEVDLIRRVVIDAEVGGVVKMWIERYGDTRLIDVSSVLTEPKVGIEITSVERPAEATPQA